MIQLLLLSPASPPITLPLNPYSWVNQALYNDLWCQNALAHTASSAWKILSAAPFTRENPTIPVILSSGGNLPEPAPSTPPTIFSAPPAHFMKLSEHASHYCNCLAPPLQCKFLKDRNYFLNLCILTLQLSAWHDMEPTIKYLPNVNFLFQLMRVLIQKKAPFPDHLGISQKQHGTHWKIFRTQTRRKV